MSTRTRFSRLCSQTTIFLSLTALLLLTGCDEMTVERVRSSIQGTWVGSYTPEHGPNSGVPRRLELRVFSNGQYHFLVQGLGGLEIAHAGRWIVQTTEGGSIELVCDHAPTDQFEVLSSQTLRLLYQGSAVEFKRQ